MRIESDKKIRGNDVFPIVNFYDFYIKIKKTPDKLTLNDIKKIRKAIQDQCFGKYEYIYKITKPYLSTNSKIVSNQMNQMISFSEPITADKAISFYIVWNDDILFEGEIAGIKFKIDYLKKHTYRVMLDKYYFNSITNDITPIAERLRRAEKLYLYVEPTPISNNDEFCFHLSSMFTKYFDCRYVYLRKVSGNITQDALIDTFNLPFDKMAFEINGYGEIFLSMYSQKFFVLRKDVIMDYSFISDLYEGVQILYKSDDYDEVKMFFELERSS